eukprot:16439556-Heterocapsa_arctica.AAC.1
MASCVKQHGHALQFRGAEGRQEVMMKADKQNGESLQFQGAEGDREVVMEAGMFFQDLAACSPPVPKATIG